ncbi:RnfABCDGE type electron transport complex subunit G [Pseudomonas sp. PDM14]|uniref:RnfABCDGE type electron transport complex subunit G n=1 Tax=Pseudomonas sp. PDM14 TaxID=2769288 RepID=UPI0017811F13|nr:RnfABCDGE type electron transport complex subunit G [Pseudomonas sp. PDM14]MBD9484494.1 RnfABCDGE type electron transport complex subunit G [Pseudomonas sp. PDM14]
MNRRQIAVILLLALLGSGLLATLQYLAAPRIEAQRQLAAERQLLDLLPASLYDNRPLAQPIALPIDSLLGNRTPRSGYRATLAGRPSAVLLPITARGYEGDIQLLVAIGADGRLLASKVLQQAETPGLGDLILPERSSWLVGFAGKTLNDNAPSWNLRADGGEFDQIAGATVTSRAVGDALQRSLRFFDAQRRYLLGEQP